jgi:mono/diheme cytochrome c family protein
MHSQAKASYRIILRLSLLMPTLLLVACAQGPAGLDWGSSSNSGSGPSLSNSNETAAVAILQQYCISCHTTTSGPNGVYDVTDPNHLLNSGLVVAGQPGSSELYTVIANGSMPPTGALSSDETATVSSWITGDQN